MPLPFQRTGGAQLRPTFSRDFAGLKTLDHGVGPAITFTRASNATYFDVNGVLQTASNDQPRFDHSGGSSLGLLIEESRTNSIRNSQAGGATVGVIGSGGVAPTNWIITANANGVTSEIIGTGTEGGLAYIDIKISGTPTSDGEVYPTPENTNVIAASSGQTWTFSSYAKLSSGAVTNASFRVYASERGSGGGDLANSGTVFTPTSSSLASQRSSVTRTFNNASTNFAAGFLGVRYTSGNPIDLTLRIAAPQLEQGAFPTSYIPTTNAAATRSADSAVVTPISSFYNQSEGTLFAEFSRYQTAGVANFLHFAGTSPNQIVLETNATSPSTLQRFLVETSAGAQANIGFSGVVASTVYRMIGAYAANSFQAAQNGTLGTEDAGGALPTISQMTIGAGKYGVGASFKMLNGHIRKIAYYPRRLSNALLQQLTT